MKRPQDINVLIACEESQIECIEFRKLGFNAFSLDIKDCSGGHPEWHIKRDAVSELYGANKYHLIIGHPPCDFLANSGVRWRVERQEWDEVYSACEFFNVFQSLGESGHKVVIENPIQHKYAREYIKKYNQIIQPYHFGLMEQKATCLWVYNLPLLKHTNNVYDEMMKLPYKERAKIHYCSPGPERSTIRSKSYQCIAEQMALQWGNYLLNETKTTLF